MKITIVELFIFICIYLTTFNKAESAVVKGSVSVHPDLPDKCWLKHPNGEAFLDINETYSRIGDCVEYYCSEDLTTIFHLCDVVPINAEISCQITPVNNSKIYPDCCPYEDCFSG